MIKGNAAIAYSLLQKVTFNVFLALSAGHTRPSRFLGRLPSAAQGGASVKSAHVWPAKHPPRSDGVLEGLLGMADALSCLMEHPGGP